MHTTFTAQLISVGMGLARVLFDFFFAYSSIKASRNLHESAFRSILRAPMSFFDVSISMSSFSIEMHAWRVQTLLLVDDQSHTNTPTPTLVQATPVGRIINRFSKDQDSVDTLIAEVLKSFMNCLSQVMSSFLLIGINLPWFLVTVAPLSFVFGPRQPNLAASIKCQG